MIQSFRATRIPAGAAIALPTIHGRKESPLAGGATAGGASFVESDEAIPISKTLVAVATCPNALDSAPSVMSGVCPFGGGMWKICAGTAAASDARKRAESGFTTLFFHEHRPLRAVHSHFR